jgi:hypothetical protein
MKKVALLLAIALVGVAMLAPRNASAASESRTRLLQSRDYIQGLSGWYSDYHRRGFTWAEVQGIRMLERMP